MALTPLSPGDQARRASDSEAGLGAGYGATLALAVILAGACFLVAMAALVLVVAPIRVAGLGALAPLVNQQNQSVKSLLYVSSFVVLLPAAALMAPRLADRIAENSGPEAFRGLVAGLVASLAAVLIVIRLSTALPWGDGLRSVLAGTGLWLAIAAILLARAASRRPGRVALRLAASSDPLVAVAAALVLGLLLCVTSLRSVSGSALALGLVLSVAVLAGYTRFPPPRLLGLAGGGIEAVFVLILVLGIVDVVVFRASGGLPTNFFPPGVIQFQQDWILAPANQLLGGGALLVNVPSSQYGVGLVYFVAGWFHLAPIGYGTFGLLDGLLTAGVYVAAYAVLRMAGVGRLLVISALVFAVLVLLYNVPYSVGALPEEGPLRFGLPMAVIVAEVAGERWPDRSRTARVFALGALAVASIWALEAFAYTAFTLASILAVKAWLMAPARRRPWLVRQAGFAAVAVLGAHALLAGLTLAGTGRWPDWTQYLGFLHALLLGGKEGNVTYGVSPWSPVLVVGLADFAAAAALLLLIRRKPALAAGRRRLLVALTGSTAYAIAALSYVDNRSSTYLLLYTSLPLLLSGVLGLHLLLGAGVASRVRVGALAFALGAAVLMAAAAWPAADAHFSRTALARAYPNGGLVGALHRLWHPPPIDPRAPEGQRLLERYVGTRRPIILLPAAPDLAIEIELRSRRSSPLFLGDPSEDVFVPSIWKPILTREISRVPAGTRALVDRIALRDLRALAGRRPDFVLDHPLADRNPQLDWILRQLERRFRLRPVFAGPDGYVVVELKPRR
jgi:hypothetical protein